MRDATSARVAAGSGRVLWTVLWSAVLILLAGGSGGAAQDRSETQDSRTQTPGTQPSDTQSPDVPPAPEDGGLTALEPGASPVPTPRETSAASELSDLTDPELFLRANQAYEEGDYRRAIALYRELLDRGHDDGHLHYNLGNALLRDGELGPAIAAYHRSLRRLPRDQDVKANLEFARRTTKDALAPPAPSPWVSTLFFWHFQMSRQELAWTVVVLNFVLWGLLALWLFRRGSELLPWLVGGVLLFLLGSGGSLLVHELWPRRVAVVLPPEVEARSGPGADAVVRFKLHAGTEVEVEDVTDGWVRIAGPNGEQAWLEDDRVAVVRW